MSAPLPKGLLLVGHGTRNERGLAEFREVARHVAELAGGFAVEACFLEIAQPDIAAGVNRMIARGVEQLTVAPVLLFAAGHAKRDIPAAVEAAIQKSGGQGSAATVSDNSRLRFSSLDVNYAPPLECHPLIVELSARRYREAIAGQPSVDPADTLLLLVGRGSSDPEALARMQHFAKLRSGLTPVGRVVVCFAAVAAPSLEAALAEAASSPYRRVVVQPHLLFAGQVVEEIAKAAVQAARCQPRQEWLLAAHLGPSPLVAQAIAEMASKAAQAAH